MLRDTDKDVITIKALDDGGFSMECKNPDGTQWGGNFYGLISYEGLRGLEGKILTIIDAAFQDREQRKAVKDIVRRTFWFDWVQNTLYRGKGDMPVGMPSENLKFN